MKLNTLFLTASLGLAAVAGAQAAIIFDSLAPYGGASVPLQYSVFIGHSFQTDAQAYTFTGVTLRMGGADTPGGNFFVRLYDATGAGSVPGVMLVPLTGSTDPALAGDYAYTGSQTLSANTVYWVVAGVSGGPGVYEWWMNASGPPAPGTAIGVAGSFDQGASWLGPEPMLLDMQVNADVNAVPEPGQWAMMAVTALGIAGYAARRVRAKANLV